MKTLIRTTIALVALATAGVAAADDATLKVYGEKCALCHGADGKGQTTMGKKVNVKDWTDGKSLKNMSDADVGKEIQVGKQMMPGFATLGEDATKAMVAYIRTLQQ